MYIFITHNNNNDNNNSDTHKSNKKVAVRVKRNISSNNKMKKAQLKVLPICIYVCGFVYV